MKKFLAFLLIALPSMVFGQAEWDREVKTDIYLIRYNTNFEQPTEIVYEINCPHGDVDRAGRTFFTSDSINTSNDDDYVDNIWDRGHMAPAAAFSCTEKDLETTFFYANVALQHQSLNRGVWRKLEEFERNLATFYPNLLVKIEVEFGDPIQRLETGAVIPTGFTKTLFFDGDAHSFYFPNDDTRGTIFMDYLIN